MWEITKRNVNIGTSIWNINFIMFRQLCIVNTADFQFKIYDQQKNDLVPFL